MDELIRWGTLVAAVVSFILWLINTFKEKNWENIAVLTQLVLIIGFYILVILRVQLNIDIKILNGISSAIRLNSILLFSVCLLLQRQRGGKWIGVQ